MADQNAVITPGPPILITSGLAGGATVYNHDSANSIWVGTTPDVSPGNGSKVGALGSVVWAQSGPIYAVVDTGVTANVNVTLSTSTTNPVDPVAVGSAVAAQLLATGVPSVLTGSAMDATPAFDFNGMDVSHFASVTISLMFLTGGGTLAYGYYDPATNTRISGRQFVIADAGPFSFTAPVKMPNFYMSVSGAPTFKNQVLYGSNRAIPETVVGITPGIQIASTAPYTSGSSTLFNQTFLTNGGPHQVRFVLTGSAQGLLQFPMYDITGGGIVYLTAVDSKEQHASPGGTTIGEYHGQIYLPPGMLKIQFYSYTTATFQFICQLVPLS